MENLASKDLPADRRKAIREHLQICNSTVKDLVERNRSASQKAKLSLVQATICNHHITEPFQRMRKAVIVGWIMELAGVALWLYGYFAVGHPSLINWHAYTPWWIADYLSNTESEIGMALAFTGMVPLYWPARR